MVFPILVVVMRALAIQLFPVDSDLHAYCKQAVARQRWQGNCWTTASIMTLISSSCPATHAPDATLVNTNDGRYALFDAYWSDLRPSETIKPEAEHRKKHTGPTSQQQSVPIFTRQHIRKLRHLANHA